MKNWTFTYFKFIIFELSKAHIHQKLLKGSTLINNALEVLSKASPSKELLEIQQAMKDLNLAELEVDVSSPQLLFNEDLIALRKAVGMDTTNGTVSITTTTQNGGADVEKLKTLETENSKLRELLIEAKTELSKLPPIPPPVSPVVPIKQADIVKEGNIDQATLDNMTSKIKAEAAANLANEIQKVKSESKLNFECEITKIKQDAEQKLATKEAELTKIRNEMKEMELKFDAEKEEMMEVAAQEIDEIEKKKNDETDQVSAEKALIQKNLDDSISQISMLKKRVQVTSTKSTALIKNYQGFSSSIKTDLQNMKYEMQSMLSGKLLGKLQKAENMIRDVEEKYRNEMMERKKLHNLVIELKGNIRVFMR